MEVFQSPPDIKMAGLRSSLAPMAERIISELNGAEQKSIPKRREEDQPATTVQWTYEDKSAPPKWIDYSPALNRVTQFLLEYINHEIVRYLKQS